MRALAEVPRAFSPYFCRIDTTRRADVFANAPAEENGYFRVRAVLEE